MPLMLIQFDSAALNAGRRRALRDAMAIFAMRMKMVVEPSGATVLAALIRHRELFQGLRVGAIISGGNVELSQFAL